MAAAKSHAVWAEWGHNGEFPGTSTNNVMSFFALQSLASEIYLLWPSFFAWERISFVSNYRKHSDHYDSLSAWARDGRKERSPCCVALSALKVPHSIVVLGSTTGSVK